MRLGRKRHDTPPHASAGVAPGAEQHPPPPRAANNLVVVILDSCRYDTFMAAAPRVITSLGPVEMRYSYATWTAPSHYNLLMGLLPHTSPPHVFASEYYKRDFVTYNTRLGTEDMEFSKLVPTLYMPVYLRDVLGYGTHARTSLPVLNPRTPLNAGFDSFKLMPTHNDMAAMLDDMTFEEDRRSFWLLNVGETHYPYATPDEDPGDWPRISGVHGVFKHLDDHVVGGKLVDDDAPTFFDRAELDALRDRQVEAVRYLDDVFARLFELVPPNTWIVVTADHGELFGEDGYFGHGPVHHDKVYEVPFLEGLRP